ncbi:MAG: EamA family transporter [Bacteroidetes bacterium]|nr:EamA family transporter [Bacteroidota bacterium]
MISLLLTILCSSSIALIIKQNSEKKGEPLLLLAGNYLAAAIISGTLFILEDQSNYSIFSFLFGAVMGGLFLFSFFAFTKAVESAGTALATVSSRISVIIPVLLSILFFNEIPSIKNIAGIFLAIITIIFFYFSLKTMTGKTLLGKDYMYLFIVLIGIGLGDFGMKVFQNLSGRNEEPFFLFMIFSFAFIYTSVFLKLKNIRIESTTAMLGAILGIPNIFSSYFLLGALSVLPAIVVYPSVNIGVILVTTFGAYLIWKENINRFGKIALVTGLAAILFLSL